MPGILKVRVISARDLPVMDSASQLTDAYAEVRLDSNVHKTPVCRKTLNPVWNQDFRFEVDDEELQDEQLVVKILDHDTFGNDNAVGQVSVDLNPLVKFDGHPQITGWFPIYDTLRGARGVLQLSIKLQLFRDQNRFRDTSCGVLFFSTIGLPDCYTMKSVHGFVEELMVNDDPEHQWIDKIRSQRASNEARQAMLGTLAGELQRKVGRKALDLGGNAVIAYRQNFDLEGDSGMVVRAVGTVVTLLEPTETRWGDVVLSPSMSNLPQIQDNLDTSLPAVSTPMRVLPMPAAVVSQSGSHNVPLITMCSFPPHLISHLGGVVAARAVKLLHKIDNPDEPETRDAWWNAIRSEIQQNALSLGYTSVIGYVETTSIHDNICVLSATGTAANIDEHPEAETMLASDLLRRVRLQSVSEIGGLSGASGISMGDLDQEFGTPNQRTQSEHVEDVQHTPCSLYHLPYTMQDQLPQDLDMNASNCLMCGQALVPEFLFCTVEPEHEIPIIGMGSMITSRVCKPRAKSGGDEASAIQVSKDIVYMEYQTHRQLINNMKIRGINTLFNLRIQITVGDSFITSVASATGVHIAALPMPSPLQVTRSIDVVDAEDEQLVHVQEMLMQQSEHYHQELEKLYDVALESGALSLPTNKIERQAQALSRSFSMPADKSMIVVEVDDELDEDMMAVLLESAAPDGFHCSTTSQVPGLTATTGLVEAKFVQVVTAIKRAVLPTTANQVNRVFAQAFEEVMQTAYFKLRRYSPCALTNVRYDISLAERNEVLITFTASVVKLEDGDSFMRQPSATGPDALFDMDDDLLSPMASSLSHVNSASSIPKEPNDLTADITTMSCVPGCKTVRHLGILGLQLIKESTSLSDAGGIERFLHLFILEVLAIARAQVVARGGNALVAYRLKQFVLEENPHKNQGQCLVILMGDVVEVAPTSFIARPITGGRVLEAMV